MRNINLLPNDAIGTFRKKKARQRWMKSCVILSLAAALTITCGQSIAGRYRKEVQNEQQAASPSRQLHRHNQHLQRMLVTWKGYESKQLAHRSAYSPLQVLQLINELHEELDGKIQIDSFIYTDSSHRESGASKKHGSVTLQIITRGTSRSAKVIQFLRESEFFIDAKLNSAIQKVTPLSDDLRFSVECTF